MCRFATNCNTTLNHSLNENKALRKGKDFSLGLPDRISNFVLSYQETAIRSHKLYFTIAQFTNSTYILSIITAVLCDICKKII